MARALHPNPVEQEMQYIVLEASIPAEKTLEPLNLLVCHL